ncbi:hypothetical protein JHK87_040448 [Glycine soja]|nr:hypothetical protein JHK87_040448 [Glycine soja]
MFCKDSGLQHVGMDNYFVGCFMWKGRHSLSVHKKDSQLFNAKTSVHKSPFLAQPSFPIVRSMLLRLYILREEFCVQQLLKE